MSKRVCNTCGNIQGPFTVYEGTYTCSPILIKENKLVGRVAECNERRKKLELKWYGPEHKEVELFKVTQE